MADVEKININGTDYDIADATARTALEDKQDVLTPGINITIDANNVISSTSSESFYKGTYGNWSSVPTNGNAYPDTPRGSGNHKPTYTDYIIIQDASTVPGSQVDMSMTMETDAYSSYPTKKLKTIIDGNTYAGTGTFYDSNIRVYTDAAGGNYSVHWKTLKNPVVYQGQTYQPGSDFLTLVIKPSSNGTRNAQLSLGSPYEGTWRFSYDGIWDTDNRAGWKGEYKVEDTLPDATDQVKGIAKLYNTTGQNTDGSMTQKSITDALNTKVNDVLVNGVSVVSNKIATINTIKSDWAQTDSTQPDYILHKPTNVSDFTNDANYQNASQVGTSITTAISTHNTASDSHSNIITPIKADITDIQALIPSAASTSNQLADKEFVNSSVATSTATFRGTYNTLAELEAQTADKEDYGFVITTDAAGNTLYNRYKYNGTEWLYEYTLNNSSFTAAQWAAINSGVSQSMVDNYLSPTSSAATAYTNRISAVESDKVDKTSTANRLYGTDSTGAQTTWQAGENIELGADGKINVTGVQQQMFEMPEATADLLGSIVQYLGDNTETYTHGVMYQCAPVYGSFSVTATGVNGVTLDEEAFKNSNLYDASISSYTFECTRGGLRQAWLLPNGQSWVGTLITYGIGYSGRPTVGATITLSRSVVGYTWEPYAGVSAGNDKIKIVGEKISGVNVVGQYNQTTMPNPTAELAGTIVQYNGLSTRLSMYRDGHFYRCEQDRTMRYYTLEADPAKYSQLDITDFMTLDSFMYNYDAPVTFVWQADGRGWIEDGTMSILGSEDLTQYGITYTLESGQTLVDGDKITVDFTPVYLWAHINVQDGVEVVDMLPEASIANSGKVVLFNSDLDARLPEPESLNVKGKLYTCVGTFNKTTGETTYEWKPLPYQFNLVQYTELPSDPTKVYTDQCIQYVGNSQVWDKYSEYVYLENGHIYRVTIVDPDDPDFAAVRYMDAHPYQMVVMPDPIAAYEGVITQYVGENGDYTNGHFYKCVPTGEMTGPSDKYKKPEDAEWSVSIDPSVLATQTTDPDQAQVFEFRSQAEGADWVLKVNDTTWTTVSIADYGITVTGTVPYGSTLKVKYVEPQPEYEWQEITVQPSGGLVDDVQIHGQSVVANRVADLSVVEQVSTMATASLDLVGRVVQYIGNTISGLVHAYFYEAITTLQHRTTTNYGIRIYDQTRFANFLKQDVESEGINVSYFTVNRNSESNLIQVRCYSTGGAFSTIHSYTDATFSTTGLTSDENIGGAIATFSIGFEWQQIDVQPREDYTAITGFDSTVKQMLVHDANSSTLKWETIA